MESMIDSPSTKLVGYRVLTGVMEKTCNLFHYNTREYTKYSVKMSYNSLFKGKESKEMTEGCG
jgi:hypothetical protein